MIPKMSILLDETFGERQIHPNLNWFCEPSQWRLRGESSGLLLHPDAATDFWQRTHYGFQADNGHFLFATVEGDVRAETRVHFRGLHQYDQAGLMLRFNSECWLKASVEFEPDRSNRLGAVVTRHGYSDWSTQDIDASLEDFAFRITRTGGDCLVEASLNDGPFTRLRMAHLDGGRPDAAGNLPRTQVGLYACSPKKAGFHAQFAFLRVEAVL